MMAARVSSGALLLVLLAAAGHSYPAERGFDSGYWYGRSYGANPAPVASSWGAAPARGFAPEAAVSGASVPKPVDSRGPNEQPESDPPSETEPEADSRVPFVDDQSEYGGGSEPYGEAAAPSPLSVEEASPALESSAPSALSPFGIIPPDPFQPPYKAGELTQVEKVFENGNYESETEDQGYQPPRPFYNPPAPSVNRSPRPPPPPPRRGLIGYPFDYMFLTGQYPPGMMTHVSGSFEQGRDHFQDTHYIRDNAPPAPTKPPADPTPPRPMPRFGGIGVPVGPYRPPGPIRKRGPVVGYGRNMAGY